MNTVQPLTLSQVVCAGACDYDGVTARWETLGLDREGLAQQPLHAVALDGAPDFAGDRQPEPGGILAPAWEHVQNEVAAGMGPPASHHTIEVSASR